MTEQAYIYEEALEAVIQAVDNALIKSPALIRRYMEHLSQSKGKLIRTRALLACALNEEEKISPDAVAFASAIEILHLATLVHDDVMDDAKLRRGIETIQYQFGRKTAVICGDYLLSLALKQFGNIASKDAYKDFSMPNYVERVCMGELRQHINNWNMDLTVYRYLSIISGKTAALFEASFHAGAATLYKDERILAQYRKLGRYLGMIFQLTDDCIDFEEEENTALKPVQSDFEQGVITLPVIIAFNEFLDAREKAKNQELSREALNAAVSESKGLFWTRQCALAYYKKALALLEKMALTGDKRVLLEALFDKAYNGLKK